MKKLRWYFVNDASTIRGLKLRRRVDPAGDGHMVIRREASFCIPSRDLYFINGIKIAIEVNAFRAECEEEAPRRE